MGGYTYLLHLIVLGFYALATGTSEDGQPSFRRLFSREADHRLSAIVRKHSTNSSVEACAGACVKETEFQCKSFDFDNTHRACLLYAVSIEDPDVYLISNPGRDHYNPSYTTLFHRLPNHMLTRGHNRRSEESVEECARRCILETFFKCRGFDYEKNIRMCYLTELTTERAGGVTLNRDWDFYERTPEGPLAEFVNYGFGHMQQMETAEVYQAHRVQISMEACASQCLQTTGCSSFDYFFNRDGYSVCYTSKFIAANVAGLVSDSGTRSMHFERTEKYLNFFYATPYTVVLGNNHKTYRRVTPNRCARMCLEEEAFVCRSFDYKVADATCLLSSKTGSDVGGLYTDDMQEVHHFEMKPMLDCGGNLTSSEGDLASPNWPRNYAHHEKCVWDIHVQKHKVIKLYFTHLDLGLRFHNPCGINEDRVTITEAVPGGEDSLCVLPNTKYFTTKSNHAKVAFYSNSEMDGQGFRAFYAAEWPCDVLLTSAPGELASPNWPDNYPASTRCSWRIIAPDNMRVHMRFSTFELERNELGHCNEQHDHVVILDGGTVSSPKIGLYCGRHAPFEVRSSGRDLFVQFKSDGLLMQPGFHATFRFETQNGTNINTSDQSEEFIPLDEEVKQPYVEKQQHEGEDKAAATGVHVPHFYKTSMWAVISTLLILLIITLVIIYFLWARLRGHRQQEEIREITAEEVPLHVAPVCNSKRNNVTDNLHGNEIDLSGGACAKDNSFANILYGDIRKDNLKNINLDTKC